jgi:anti-sigma factor ChrR (cupin superfamily)
MKPNVKNTRSLSWGSLENAESRQLFPGIIARTVWQGQDHSKAIVVDFEPGSKWEGPDIHEPGPEELFVISGIFNDGERDFPPGSFIHNPKGSSHVPQSVLGCKLFLFFPEG